MTDDVRSRLVEHIRRLRVASTHDHHGYDQWHKGLNMTRLLRSSCAPWGNTDPETMHQQREDFLKRVRHNTQYVWLVRALGELYGFDEITAENWDAVSRALRLAHENRSWHLDILRERCRYDVSILDSFQEPGSNQGHPELFRPSYRVDMFLVSAHEELADHDGHNALVLYDEHPPNFDDYLDFVTERIRAARQAGCVAIKLASAYDRTLSFASPLRSEAARIYGLHPSMLKPGDLVTFGNCVLHHILASAGKLELPVQVHLGVMSLENANPLEFAGVLARYPGIRFDLFHGGYPWTGVLAAFGHNYRNAWLDLCWLPLISTSHAEWALNEWLDATGSCERIVWGGDAMTGEETYGAVLAIEQVLTNVLSERIRLGLTDLDGACDLAGKILHDNAKKLFGL